MAAPAASSGSGPVGATASGWPPGAASDFPDLHAVVANTPAAFSASAAPGPFSSYPCELAPLHLAAALGREECIRALLDAGASPCLWTRPPSAAPRAADSDGDVGSGGEEEEEYAGYEGVCSSPLYQALKQQLPNSSPFPYTFTLAQLLLRTPCSPLLLAVRFGQQGAARALLAAMQRAAGGGDAPADGGSDCDRASSTHDCSSSSSASTTGSSTSGSSSSSSDVPASSAATLALHLDAALAVWPAASEPALPLLQCLLAAGGGAHPLRRLLPAVLARYQNCSAASPMAEKLRGGLQEVLRHVLPAVEEGPGGPGSDGDVRRVESVPTAAAEARMHWRAGLPPPNTAALHQLLYAAVACRDAQRCTPVLAALEASCGSPWRDAAANCALLTAAAAHDCGGVVAALLALPPPPGAGLPPFNADMWGPDGLSALMAAAHRGALGALASLLAAGATVNLADEMGASALHWAVVGGSQDAVMMLAQAGAAVDLAGVVHEEEEHMERPLLTAVVRGDLAMARLLRGLGASLDAPAPTGATPLSAAVCWEQREAAELLLELGADPNQVLPAHINGGAYPMWSDSYSAEEAHTLLGMACSRCDHADFLALLLKGGADPSLRHPLTGLTPAAEAAGIGAVDEAAELIERAAVPRGPWTLEQLGWAEAVAQAVGSFFWHHIPSPAEALDPLLDVWRRQPGPPPPPPPPSACTAIVTALLGHPALQLADGAAALQSGAELAGVLQAERLACIGVAADLTHLLRQPGSECRRNVVLAAAPAASRWSPATHRHFPPAFKHTVRALLLANHRLGASRASAGSSPEPGPAASPAAGSDDPPHDDEGPPPLVDDEEDGDCLALGGAGTGAAFGRAAPPAAGPALGEPGGGSGMPRRRVPKVASAAELGGHGAAVGSRREAGEGCMGTGSSGPGTAASCSSGDTPSTEPAGCSGDQASLRPGASQRGAEAAAGAGGVGTAAPGSEAGSPSAAVSPAEGGQCAAAGRAGPLGLPRDAVHEVVRLLGSMPLSYWMAAHAPQVQPAAGGRTQVLTPQLPDFIV